MDGAPTRALGVVAAAAVSAAPTTAASVVAPFTYKWVKTAVTHTKEAFVVIVFATRKCAMLSGMIH